ncbi:hypothetical protein CVT25_014027 [Psilocybe cyanescens]|uniref:Uncharacterized protein n=1 Tax=Psilocybe cyanescens TaxID=93625 RepID=A0A409XPR7_PSICY|nr:hypothetical protein CVT25_014027 [Psilocybe cyanescens]
MPKISSTPSARPSCSYNSLLRTALQQSQINAIYAFLETQPVWNGKDTKDIYSINQAALWLNDALLRRDHKLVIERPKVDVFETRGRTIYDAKPIDFDTPLPQTQHSPVRSLMQIIKNLDKLVPETHIHPVQNAPEPVTPPKRVRVEARAKHRRRRMPTPELCLDDMTSSPSLSRSKRSGPELQTLFLAITKGAKRFVPECITPNPIYCRLQKAEFIPESPKRRTSIPNSPEYCILDDSPDRRSWSRSSTPSLSWSVSSANSSPESDRTIDWDEECSGPELIAIEPINFQPEGADAAEYTRLERFSSGKIVEAESFDDSFYQFFELFVNTEECH